MDGVQDGHFRTGRFQSFQRILEGVGEASGLPGRNDESPTDVEVAGARREALDFLPDGVSMAKSLGGGFPIGAFWVRGPYADLLGPGAHATTFGGTPLACAVALRVLEVIERDNLVHNARAVGDYLKNELIRLSARFPSVIKTVRGLGLMLGIELAADIPAFVTNGKAPALQCVHRLYEAGLLTIPSATRTRVSFEVGIRELGGQALFLSAQDIQIGRGELVKDTARVLGRMIHGAIIRTYAQSDVEQFAQYSGVPTVNALTDQEHPCQVLSDIFTFQEKRGRIGGKVVTFIGDGACNVPVSWVWAASKLEFDF